MKIMTRRQFNTALVTVFGAYLVGQTSEGPRLEGEAVFNHNEITLRDLLEAKSALDEQNVPMDNRTILITQKQAKSLAKICRTPWKNLFEQSQTVVGFGIKERV